MSDLQIACVPRPDATPEADITTLANVYKFVLDCRAKNEAAHESRSDDARKDQAPMHPSKTRREVAM
jgi:hypothetical protein